MITETHEAGATQLACLRDEDHRPPDSQGPVSARPPAGDSTPDRNRHTARGGCGYCN
jgi:hypothetical protein